MLCRRIVLSVIAASICIGVLTACSRGLSLPNPDSVQPAPSASQLPLPTPAEVLRTSSRVLTEPFAYGADFDPAVSHPAAKAAGREVLLETTDIGEQDEYGHYPLRPVHAVYRFDLTDYAGPPAFTFAGDTSQLQQFDPVTGAIKHVAMAWLGLSNWQTGRWQWFALDGAKFELPSLAPYIAPDGTMLLVWMGLQQNRQAGRLSWLRIGDSPLQPEVVAISSTTLYSGLVRGLALDITGSPTVLTGYKDSGYHLFEHATGSWTERQLELPSGTDVAALEISPLGDPYVLAQSRTDNAETGLRTLDTSLVNITTEPEAVSPVRRFSIAIPEGPDGPGGGSDTPTTRASNIDFDAAGTPQLSYRQLNQVYTAWTDGQAWASLAFPGPPLDFAVDAGGTAWAATRASG